MSRFHFLSRVKKIALLCFCLASFEALADVGTFIEPALTYEMGNTRVDYPSPLSSSTGHVNGFGIAARVGIQFEDIFFAGLDGRYSLPRFTDSAFGYDADAKALQLGPVVGVQTPFLVGLRLWVSYIMTGSLDPASNGNADVRFDQATGYRIGAGFRVALLSLNLEYQSLRYGSTTLQSAGNYNFNSTFDSVKLNQDSWIASVSVPIDL
jgi:hypothetical protein